MEQNTLAGMVDVTVSPNALQRVYRLYSKLYFIAAPFEKPAKMRAIHLAEIKPTDQVLEVAVGTGSVFIDILKKVSPEIKVNGIDFSPEMVAKTSARVRKKGFKNFTLQQGDARALPFPDESFDVLFNSYMLDLIPLAVLPSVIKEFNRVLKKNGRLVLVSLSKKSERKNIYERVYGIVPALLGGCRPVLMRRLVKTMGFHDVRREFHAFPVPSEIIVAIKT